ncbi:MAG: hypothetical protein WAT68_00700 [Candidatus Nitrotoga sp.]
MRIIVTDLTRFNNKLLCLAGLSEDGECIRPQLPSNPYYLSFEFCKESNILPGTILNGVFTKPQKIDAPHIEDSYFSSLKTVGSVSSTEFQAILDRSSFISIKAGFELTSNPIKNFLPLPPCKSIITLKLQPKDLHIAHDQYDINKIKAHLTDADGLTLSFIPIKDLGFCDNVGQEATRKKTAQEMTEYLHTQDMLYVRLGVGRKFKSKDGRDGFWMQVNGIYSFPNYEHILRAY